MLFFGFILCWLIGLLTGTLFAFFIFYVHDGPLIAEPGPATIIGWTGWFYAACILLVFLMYNRSDRNEDFSSQTNEMNTVGFTTSANP